MKKLHNEPIKSEDGENRLSIPEEHLSHFFASMENRNRVSTFSNDVQESKTNRQRQYDMARNQIKSVQAPRPAVHSNNLRKLLDIPENHVGIGRNDCMSAE